ncbi:hypothetical protein SSS_09783, partial [Sarcoptes scabiei]
MNFLHFLERFMSTKISLELCDVKFDDFGLLKHSDSGQPYLVALDSDLILESKTVELTINQTTTCFNDEDCHLVDCYGICHNGRCQKDRADSNLRRICRNIFFIYSSFMGFELGLFAKNWPRLRQASLHDSIDELYNLCFRPSIDVEQFKIIKI